LHCRFTVLLLCDEFLEWRVVLLNY
jgi:hypothetical protein